MLQFSAIYWDPRPELFRIPYLNWPVFWYGILFALGFSIGFPLFVGILNRFFGGKQYKKRSTQIADRLTLYIILGTVIGARLGHFVFYEHPIQYLQDPLQFFRVWEGGLASHGGAIGVIVALIFFSWRTRVLEPELTWIRLLDFVSPPAALAGFFIRIGNFINQEVLGTNTNLPWGVVFGHPADHSAPSARHPVQIYEALFYLAVFFVLWKLTFKNYFLKTEGKLIGICLVLIFGFRFFIEFLKTEQSHLISFSALNMGQILSIPLVLIGIFFVFKKISSNRPP